MAIAEFTKVFYRMVCRIAGTYNEKPDSFSAEIFAIFEIIYSQQEIMDPKLCVSFNCC